MSFLKRLAGKIVHYIPHPPRAVSVTSPVLWAYGRFAHKDDPLQVSAGRPAPTISPMSCVKLQIIVYTCIIITCIIMICIILLALSQV